MGKEKEKIPRKKRNLKFTIQFDFTLNLGDLKILQLPDWQLGSELTFLDSFSLYLCVSVRVCVWVMCVQVLPVQKRVANPLEHSDRQLAVS